MPETLPRGIPPGDWFRDPHACFARHRAEHWWAPFEGIPLTEVLEYRAVRELLATGAPLCAYDGGFIEDVMRGNPALSEDHIRVMREATARSLINNDGPEHDRLRALVARAFTPGSMEKLRTTIELLAHDLAGEIASGDDFMQGFGRHFPATAICRMIGVSEEDRERFISWIDVLEVQTAPANLSRLDRDAAAEVLRVQLELHAYIRCLVDDRRADPRDDLVSRLARDAAAVGDEAVVQLVSDMMFAGNATTRNALGNMVLALVSHAEIWELVAAAAERAEPVVEEVLRLHGPTPGPVRRAGRTCQYRDHTFEEHDVVALSIWSANRDEAFWGADADAFDPARPHAGEHLTFGHGPHFCLGAAFARELLRAALVALARRLTDLSLPEAPAMLPYGGVYGPTRLKLAFRVRS